MAERSAVTVMVVTYVFLVLLTLLAFTTAAICPDKQYLNAKHQACVNCTVCQDELVVLRPCEIHRDTKCGPIDELLKVMSSVNPHRHHHERHHHQRHHDKDIEWRYGDEVKSATDTTPSTLEVKSSEVPFSSAETLVWDWQAVALTSAVFACILFFLVITLYSLHQARQWRRLKENFEADVEELSARLSLMAAASASEKADLDSPSTPGSNSSMDPNYLNSKCIYLEQLLSVRKEDEKTGTIPRGNVYIEENKPKT